MNKKYTTLLFDLDDTLMDFGKAEDNAINILLQSYDVPISDENKQIYIELNKSLWKALEKGEITREQLWAKRFTEYFKILGIEADGVKANFEFMSYIAQGSFMIDGALETCRALHMDYKIYIITNGSKMAQQGRLTKSPLLEYIDGVFISEEIGFVKPEKGFFDYVFSVIDEKDKAKVLVIGDSLSSDIEGAVSYGLDSCWLNRGEEKENNATFQIKYISQITDIL